MLSMPAQPGMAQHSSSCQEEILSLNQHQVSLACVCVCIGMGVVGWLHLPPALSFPLPSVILGPPVLVDAVFQLHCS